LKKKLTKNYLYNLVYHALNIIVPMLTVPYVTRIILPAQMGIFSTSQSLFTIIVIAAQFGVLTYGTREIAMAYNNKKLMLERFQHIFSTQVLTTILFLIPCFFLSLGIAGNNEVGWIYAVNALLILNATFDISWFYNGQEEFKITITRNIFVKFIAIPLIFILVKDKDDIIIYTLIYVLSAFIGNISMFAGLKKFAGTFHIFSYKWIDKSVIKEALPYMAPMILSMIFVEISRFFVYGISGQTVTGIYDQALKIARMMIVITTALLGVTSPRMSMFVSSNTYNVMRQYYAKIFIFLLFQSFLIACGILLVGNDFVSLFFGPKYAKVAPVLQVFSVYPLIFVLDQCVVSLLLRPLGLTHAMLISILISLGINITLNLLLVPALGAIGGALALIISTLISALIQTYSCWKFILWQPILKNAGIMIISGVCTTTLLLFIKKFIFFSALANFFIYGAICIILFSSIVFFLAKDIRDYLFEFIHSLVKKYRKS